jgi:hypothetical protein
MCAAAGDPFAWATICPLLCELPMHQSNKSNRFDAAVLVSTHVAVNLHLN